MPPRPNPSQTAIRKRIRRLEQQTERLLGEIRLALRELTAGSAAPMAGLRLRSKVRRP
jgi:hypothetical protein